MEEDIEKEFVLENDMQITPETYIELAKWQNDPAFRERYSDFINKDLVFGNLDRDDYSTVINEIELAWQCFKIGWLDTSDFLIFRCASILNASNSKDGFVRRQEKTVIQKKDISLEKQKGGGGLKFWR